MSEMHSRADALMSRLDTLAKAAKTARVTEAVAKVHFERVQDRVGRMIAQKQLALWQRDDIRTSMDPVTEEPNPKWTESLIQSFLNEDEEYLRGLADHNEAKRELEQASVNHVNITEEIGIVKAQVRLMSVLVEYGSS